MSELEPTDRGLPAQAQGKISFELTQYFGGFPCPRFLLRYIIPFNGIDDEEIVLHPKKYPPDICEQAFLRLQRRLSTQSLEPENMTTLLEKKHLQRCGLAEVVPGHNNYRLPT